MKCTLFTRHGSRASHTWHEAGVRLQKPGTRGKGDFEEGGGGEFKGNSKDVLGLSSRKSRVPAGVGNRKSSLREGGYSEGASPR